jgi:hypothetical protein
VKQRQQPGNIELGANIEVGLIEVMEELEYFATRPGCCVEILGHKELRSFSVKQTISLRRFAVIQPESYPRTQTNSLLYAFSDSRASASIRGPNN